MKNWRHQDFAFSELARLTGDGYRRIVVTSPTGAGKSRMMEQYIQEHRSVSLYTHRRMLLKQTGEVLERGGVRFGYRAARIEPRLLDDVQLCMVQSETGAVKRGRDVHTADCVVIDEVHNLGGDSMLNLLKLHRGKKPDLIQVGFTATPLGISHMADTLIIAGTNSELRKCGALVKAYHYQPDEPDQKWIGKVKTDGGECGIPNNRRMDYSHRVFGSVIEHYHQYNPHQKPALLFAPGVKESIWFAQEFCRHGIPAAHIDGKNCWVDGELHENNEDIRDDIARRSKNGEIKLVSNRFCLREGVNWPWLYHGIFATVFGSLTTYIQAGGRILRNDSTLDGFVCISDHGGNGWRHGSLNADRDWKLEYTDAIMAGMRKDEFRSKTEREPITCPKCHAMRLTGSECYDCGYRHQQSVRMVLQKDGSLKAMKGDIYRQPRYLVDDDKNRQDFLARARAIRRSKKPKVQSMTFAQLEATFARDHNWEYPHRDWPGMPIRPIDMYRRVSEVSEVKE